MYINDYFVNNYGYDRVKDYNDDLTISSSYPSVRNSNEIVKIKRTQY